MTVLCSVMVCCSKVSKDPKQEILRILEIQELAYDDQTEENKKKFMETCTDSVMFVSGDDGGVLMTPLVYVNDFADGYLAKPHDRKFQFYDNTVIVTSLHQGFIVLGTDSLLLNSRSTKVFVKEKDQWKMAYVTFAPVPVLYNKIIQPNEAVFKNYAGVYAGARGARDSVYVVNGKVFVSGDELLPVNDSTFVGKTYFGKTIFSKDHYTFEWIDGQRISFRKIK